MTIFQIRFCWNNIKMIKIDFFSLVNYWSFPVVIPHEWPEKLYIEYFK